VWQLICHHTYKYRGYAIDLSPFHNDGKRSNSVEVLADGAAVGSGSLRFEDQAARVVVKPADPGFRAVKIEVVAQIDPNVNALRIVALGDYSFALGINSDRFLTGAIWQAGVAHSLSSTSADAPDGQDHYVPTGRWTQLGLLYDGAGSLSLSMDGKVVAQKSIPFGMQAIGSRGLAIGNAHDHAGGGPLHGEIDEIRIWRYHPNSVLDEFCSRPIDDAAGLCWDRLVESVRRALETRPDCAAALRGALKEDIERALIAMAGLPPPERNKLKAALQSFVDLWANGAHPDAQMRTVLEAIVSVLRSNGVDLVSNGERTRLTRLSCLEDVARELSSIDCDPNFLGLMRLLGEITGRQL
jgi:Concanavalin A-like lectin/glucanases superfamily